MCRIIESGPGQYIQGTHPSWAEAVHTKHPPLPNFANQYLPRLHTQNYKSQDSVSSTDVVHQARECLHIFGNNKHDHT